MMLLHPFTCLVSGPTGCGKSSLVRDIILQNGVTPKPQRMVWLYVEDQPMYKSLAKHGVEFIQGIPDNFEDMFDARHTNLLILDDLMTQCHSDARLTRMFSVGSHHRNLSIIFIIHNLFHQGKEMRNLSLNSHYIILFKNPRDSLQIATLGRQMYPSRSRFLIEAYQNATKHSYGYLMLDLKPTTTDKMRVRTNILPTNLQIIFVHKDDVEESNNLVQ